LFEENYVKVLQGYEEIGTLFKVISYALSIGKIEVSDLQRVFVNKTRTKTIAFE